MKQSYLRNIIGAIIVVGHLALVVVAVSYLGRALEAEQQTQVLLSLGPVAATYFAAVVKKAIRDRYKQADDIRVNMSFCFYSIIIVGFFMLSLFYFCLSFPNSLVGDANALAKWISGLEVALGGTLGLIVDALFPTASLHDEVDSGTRRALPYPKE